MKSSGNYYHKIPLPDGDNVSLSFNYKSRDGRESKIQELISKYEDYCNNNWITFNSGGFGNTPEDKVKRFLDNLATYYLMFDSVDNDMQEYDDINKIKEYEIHLNSFIDNIYEPENIEEAVNAINNYIKETESGDGKIIQPEPIVDKVAERRKARTKLDKFNDIYGTKANKYFDYIEDNRLPYMPKYWTEVENNIKVVNGVIDKNKPHKVKWVNVRVDRRFSFDSKTFRISEDAKQYLYTGHTKRYETYRDDFKMVKVLCFEQYGKYYFYDENIDEITEMVELEN